MLSVLALTTLAAAECGTDSIDTLHGDEPLVSQLLDAAKTFSVGMFSDGEFESRDTVYLGQLAGPSGPLHLAWVETIWGASSCRASQQLIVFDATLRPVATSPSSGPRSSPPTPCRSPTRSSRSPTGRSPARCRSAWRWPTTASRCRAWPTRSAPAAPGSRRGSSRAAQRECAG